jgi:hypothetical protein
LPGAVKNRAAIKSKGGKTNTIKRGGIVWVTVKNPFNESIVITVSQTNINITDSFEKGVAL